MFKKTNKYKKILSSLAIGIPTIIAPTLIGLTSCSIEIPESKPLTNKIVKENFQVNGIWYNKTVIEHSDLAGFSSISNDAFDNIENKIDEIKLPGTISVQNPEKGIIWKNVAKITQEEQSIIVPISFTKNNILYTLSDNAYYIALTIADRIQKISELTLPTKQDLNFKLKLNYMISSNFYDEVVFQNVDHIKFPANTPLCMMGVNAFKGCQKLDSVLNLSIDLFSSENTQKTGLTFYKNSFANSNITELNIDAKNVSFGSFVISELGKIDTFKKISINNIPYVWLQRDMLPPTNAKNGITDLLISNSKIVYLQTGLFTNFNRISNIDIQANEAILCASELFSNEIQLDLNMKLRSKQIVLSETFMRSRFNSFNLTLDTMGNLENSIILTENSFSDLQCPNQNFSIKYPEKIIFNQDQIDFANSGLTIDQQDNLIPIANQTK